MIGIICFLIVVVLAKILTSFTTPNGIYQQAADGLLFANFWLLLLIGIILFIADIFAAFPFPLSLPAPIIKAVGSVFCVVFVLRVFQWVDGIAATNLYHLFLILSFLIVPLIFIIVLATGYFEIMRKLWWYPKNGHEPGTVAVYKESPVNSDNPTSDAKSWEEISAEFRLMIYDIIHRFREEIKRKE
jgi:predicted membrane protein